MDSTHLKKRLLLLATANRPKHLFKIRNLFASFSDWEVKFIDVKDRHIHPNSVLFLPDTKGLNCTVSYVESGHQIYGVKPQDPVLEAFRLEMLHYYVAKKVGVFGIGSSALLTFAEVLKGKLSLSPGPKPELWFTGDIHTKAYFPSPEKFFSQGEKLCGGAVDYELNEDLVSFVEEIFFKRPQELVPVPAKLSPPTLPPARYL